MNERQDYIALEWVAGEIGETLKQASQALKAYIANRDDVSKLRFCLTHIHQVHGTLQMVEFFGAALLAEEMESLAHDLSQGSIHNSHIEDALLVLQSAIVQLPLYLKKVKQNRHGLPATLLPVLNDLRAVRGESLLSETVLFSPAMPAANARKEGAELKITVTELADVAHKLRQMFQIALLGLIRGNDVNKNLNYLAKVCARMVKLTDGFPQQSLWRICIAVLEGLLNGSIASSVAVKILLRQVDRQIKCFIDEGEAALENPAPQDLLKNLLYYVARSKAESRYISEIKTEYNLHSSLLGGGELADEELATPDSSTMQSVVEALVHELQAIQTAFDQAGNESEKLADVLPLFKRVSDTMAILGLGAALKQLQVPYSKLAKLLATQDHVSDEDLQAINRQLALAKTELDSVGIAADKPANSLFNDSEEAQAHLDRAFDSVVQESRHGLEQAKDAVVEFVASQWNHDCLEGLPGLLTEIAGSLNMVPLSRAAKILQACENYVSKILLANNSIPEWQMLDTLADAITSVDYYLERLVDNSPDGEMILDVAAESVAELGFPVGDSDAAASQQTTTGQSEDETEDQQYAEQSSEEYSGQSITTAAEIVDVAAEAAVEPPVLAEVIDYPDAIAAAAETEEAPETQDTQPSTDNSDDALLPAMETASAADAVDEEDDDFDPEIVEIFVEEAGEVVDTVNEYAPQWQANIADKELGATVRRAFHTLKGSGRMVGATDLGELAWSIENMLNRVQDGSVAMDQQRFDLITESLLLVPGLVSAFEQREAVDTAPQQAIIAKAEQLAQQQNLEFTAPLDEALAAAEDDQQAPVSGGNEVDIPTITDVLDLSSDEQADTAADDFATVELDQGDNFNQELDEEVDEGLDEELLEIFAAETAVHGQVLDDFIARCDDLAGPAEFTDELQRALHTLKGSANMAGIIPVVTVVTPLEYVVKELRASQLKVDKPLLVLLERGSQLIKEGISQLALSPLQPLADAESYNKELMDLFNDRMAQAADSNAEDAGIPPEALNLFLTESLDLITEMSGKLVLWQQNQATEEESHQLQGLMDNFIQHAASVNMLAPMELGEAIQAFYRRASENLSGVDGSFFTLANAANDGLIDMLDQIAGHQTPAMKVELFNRIQDYEFNQPVEISVPVDEQTASIESNILDQFAPVSLLDTDVAADADDESMLFVDIGEIEGEHFDVDNLDFANFAEQLTTADSTAENEPQPTDAKEILPPETAETAAPVEYNPPPQPVEPPVLTRHSAVAEDDDDIDEEIIEIFLEEADDLLENLDESLHGWTDDRGNRSYLDDLLRILHTLKGGARLAGLVEVGDLSHDFETVLMKFEHQPSALDDSSLNDIQRYQDQLIARIAAIKAGERAGGIPTETVAAETSAAAEQSQQLVEVDDQPPAEVDETVLELTPAEDAVEPPAQLVNADDSAEEVSETLNETLSEDNGDVSNDLIDVAGEAEHDSEAAQAASDDSEAESLESAVDEIVEALDMGAATPEEHWVEPQQDSAIVSESVAATLEDSAAEADTIELDQNLAEQLSGASEMDDTVDFDLADIDLADIDLAESDSSVIDGTEEDAATAETIEPPAAASKVVAISDQRPRQVSPLEIATPLIDPSARKAPQEVVKVSAQLLEELVNLAGETSISRGRAEEQISELVFSLEDMQVTVDRLQEQVRRLDMETEQQILYRQEQVESEGLEGFDPLEMDRYSQLQQLSRSLLESSSDLVDIKSTLSDKSRDMETLLIQQSRINTDLQEGLMRSRMVPFSRMVPRLRRIVRQISGELNKQVDLHLKNVEGELDRTVLERMVSPLEHMLRNAVDHGIESAEQRAAAGKSARGSVTLNLSREGGEIVLVLKDDGAGIDLVAVKSKAIERGLMEPGADLSDHEILQFILQSGFSTAAAITQISGRGVGMDVVHSEIKQLGGSMDIDSAAGKGSTFTVRLPFTVSVNRALMVTVGGDSYAIPLNTIEGIVRVSPFELEAYYQPDAPMFEYAGQPYLLRYMGALLQRGDKPILEGQSMPLPVVLVRGAEHSVAVQVDSLMGSREIVVKPLGPQFGQVQGLSGATVLGDGSVVVILDLLALIRADASHLHRNLAHNKDHALSQDKSILVMVVDDSVTVRKVTSRFLERQGMDVLLAKDGVDAVTQLQEIERLPDVMLLDIEMPRMDGFEVANRVRHNSRIKDLPIIMITSRTGEKHRERALALGVNEYLGKPYQESTLLETIQSLTGASLTS
jgi:chemosensory pili system protein ChpA (sensor histidine kinase/response regulator)